MPANHSSLPAGDCRYAIDYDHVASRITYVLRIRRILLHISFVKRIQNDVQDDVMRDAKTAQLSGRPRSINIQAGGHGPSMPEQPFTASRCPARDISVPLSEIYCTYHLNVRPPPGFANVGPSTWNSLPDPVRNRNATKAACRHV